MRERFSVTNEKALFCRFHTQTGGSTLTANQIDNNILQWWNSKNVQKTIVLIKDEFINNFSITKFKKYFNDD